MEFTVCKTFQDRQFLGRTNNNIGISFCRVALFGSCILHADAEVLILQFAFVNRIVNGSCCLAGYLSELLVGYEVLEAPVRVGLNGQRIDAVGHVGSIHIAAVNALNGIPCKVDGGGSSADSCEVLHWAKLVCTNEYAHFLRLRAVARGVGSYYIICISLTALNIGVLPGLFRTHGHASQRVHEHAVTVNLNILSTCQVRTVNGLGRSGEAQVHFQRTLGTGLGSQVSYSSRSSRLSTQLNRELLEVQTPHVGIRNSVDSNKILTVLSYAEFSLKVC